MTRTENEAIEIFCRVLASEIHQITGRTMESKPGWLVVVGENDQRRNEDQTSPGACNDLQTSSA
jgi:hypothetical protein